MDFFFSSDVAPTASRPATDGHATAASDGSGGAGLASVGAGFGLDALASLAQAAVSQVERRIDRVLDISEEETAAAKATAAQRRTPPSPSRLPAARTRTRDH